MVMILIVVTGGYFHTLVDMLLGTILNMVTLHRGILPRDILHRHIPHRDILLMDILHKATNRWDTLPQGGTLRQAILPRVDILHQVILVRRLHITRGMDLVWEHCWQEVLLLLPLHMVLINSHMVLIIPDMGVTMAMVMVMVMAMAMDMESLNMANLARMACLESTSSRDGSDREPIPTSSAHT